ncbi:hypothetical protein HN011_008042 [Eciton burchellii]|nr:hypothetical protein HN011_008042 [Eciton burchellii]
MCYQHDLLSGARVPWVIFRGAVYWTDLVASCQFAGSYDNVGYTAIGLAFRQQGGIAVKDSKASRYGDGGEGFLILQETLTTSPADDLAVPPYA